MVEFTVISKNKFPSIIHNGKHVGSIVQTDGKWEECYFVGAPAYNLEEKITIEQKIKELEQAG